MSRGLPNKLVRAFEYVEGAFAIFAGFVIVALMALTVVDVSGRYLFNSPLLGALEISEMGLAPIVFLGIAYVQRREAHISVNVFLPLLPKRLAVAVNLFGLLLGLVMVAIFTWQSWLYFWEAWLIKDYVPGIVPVPIWPALVMAPLGAFLMCVRLIIGISTNAPKLVAAEGAK